MSPGTSYAVFSPSVVIGRKGRIPRMLEHAPDLRHGDARQRQRRERVLGEEIHRGGLVARAGSAADQVAPEEEFVSMEALGRVLVSELVVDRQELRGPHPVARLLLDLARRGHAGRLAHVAPAARQRPAAIAPLLHQQDLIVFEDGGANVHLRGGIPSVGREMRHHLIGRRPGPLCQHFGCEAAYLLPPIALERVFGERQTVLREGRESQGTPEPRRGVHPGNIDKPSGAYRCFRKKAYALRNLSTRIPRAMRMGGSDTAPTDRTNASRPAGMWKVSGG